MSLPLPSTCSPQHRPDHLAVDIREAALAAVVVVGELLVVQAEQVQGGGVKVVDRADVFWRCVTRLQSKKPGRWGLTRISFARDSPSSRPPSGPAIPPK